MKNYISGPRPRGEDYLRALGYALLGVWAVLFWVFPPASVLGEMAGSIRLFWMTVTFLGSLMAATGALLRIDLKLELPGIIVALLGPIFYFAVQVYYVIFPLVGTVSSDRYAFAAYVIIPAVMMTPRLYGLAQEAKRIKSIAQFNNAYLGNEATQEGK